MVVSTLFLGFLGVGIFLIILFTYNKLLKNHESGFLHLLMSFMFLCWLPLPLVFYIKLNSYHFLLIGTIFGAISIFIYFFTMILQASHLSYSMKNYPDQRDYWDKVDSWILNGLLGSQVELIAGFLEGIWSIFLTLVFYLEGQTIFFFLGFIYSLFTLVYLFELLKFSLVKEIKWLKVININYYFANIKTVTWIIILLIWLI